MRAWPTVAPARPRSPGERQRAGGRLTTLAERGIEIARGSLARLGTLAHDRLPDAHRFVIITDDHVGPLYAADAADALGPERTLELRVAAGERSKTRETWSALTDRMLDARCGRDTVVVALGGGMIGDLAGFVAATYMRGIPVVQVPTSLLAMVDASIGGKTAVDTPHGKNLVGAFHAPALVVVDPGVLETLPGRERRAGAAEMLKHGVIGDAEHFDQLARDLPRLLDQPSEDAWTPLIRRSIEIKSGVVSADFRESGLRKTLNFGHTLGHAIESASGFALLHGECVAIGMALESRLAERVDVARGGTAARVAEAIRAVGLPVERPTSTSPERVLEEMRVDKKARLGRVEFALPRRVGDMAPGEGGWSIAVPDEVVLEVLR